VILLSLLEWRVVTCARNWRQWGILKESMNLNSAPFSLESLTYAFMFTVHGSRTVHSFSVIAVHCVRMDDFDTDQLCMYKISKPILTLVHSHQLKQCHERLHPPQSELTLNSIKKFTLAFKLNSVLRPNEHNAMIFIQHTATSHRPFPHSSLEKLKHACLPTRRGFRRNGGWSR
jgi:hypothetical protein